MAENAGGVCMISPMNCGSSASIAARDGRMSLVATTCALGVVGIGVRAPAHGEAVVLRAVDGVRHGLGGLAERDRQHAGRQRIERAGMPGLLRIEQAAHGADRLRRGHAGRLVQHQPAVDRICPSCGVPCSIRSR